MARDRYERKHRKTHKNPEAMTTMANANFDAVPSLAEAMGVELVEGVAWQNATAEELERLRQDRDNGDNPFDDIPF